LKGWLLDTNVVASLIAANGAPSVMAWAASEDEERMWLSVLTLGEYDKGIANLADDNPKRARFAAIRDRLEARFDGRVLSVSDDVVRRWGALSGRIRRDTGHPPPVIDTMFAATAIEHNLCLVTRSVRDVVATGVNLFNPWGVP
jgi:predicted nucleic acid-binding protein